MNQTIEQIKKYFESGVKENSRMINVRLFRRKVNNTWEWVIDADTMNEQGDAIIDTARAVKSLTPVEEMKHENTLDRKTNNSNSNNILSAANNSTQPGLEGLI